MYNKRVARPQSGRSNLSLSKDCFGADAPRNDKGVALITVIIVMLTMALIGAALAELSSAVSDSVDNMLDETKARYLAEAGIAHALRELRHGADLSDAIDKITGEPIYFPLGEGGYSVVFDPEGSMITCTGIVHETKKTMQFQYNVF